MNSRALPLARPADPHLWLAERLLARSPEAKKFEIVERVLKPKAARSPGRQEEAATRPLSR